MPSSAASSRTRRARDSRAGCARRPAGSRASRRGRRTGCRGWPRGPCRRGRGATAAAARGRIRAPAEQPAVGPLVGADPAGHDHAARAPRRRPSRASPRPRSTGATTTSAASPPSPSGATVRRRRASCGATRAVEHELRAHRAGSAAPNSARRLASSRARCASSSSGRPSVTSSVSNTPNTGSGRPSSGAPTAGPATVGEGACAVPDELDKVLAQHLAGGAPGDLVAELDHLRDLVVRRGARGRSGSARAPGRRRRARRRP